LNDRKPLFLPETISKGNNNLQLLLYKRDIAIIKGKREIEKVLILGARRKILKNMGCFVVAVVRTTQQNKILVHCWTTLFQTYIKQAKK